MYINNNFMLLILHSYVTVTVMLIIFSVETLVLQDGKTPLQLAKGQYKHETVKYLESYLQEVWYLTLYLIINSIANTSN